MAGLPHHGHRAGDRAPGVYQVGGRQRTAALLALVAVGTVVLAVGAGPHDVAVGQELSGLLVVILHGGLLREDALVVERAEEIGGRPVVHGRGGARIDVERHAQPFERLLDDIVVFVDDVLRRYALLPGLDGDRHAVLVRSAHRDHVLAPQAQVTGVDVGRDVNSRQVADVDRAVGVGKGRSDQITLEFFHVRYVTKSILLQSYGFFRGIRRGGPIFSGLRSPGRRRP